MKRPFVVIYGWRTFRRASRLQLARAQPAGKINFSISTRRKLNSSISPKFTSTILLNRKSKLASVLVFSCFLAANACELVFTLASFCFWPQDLERSYVACFLFHSSICFLFCFWPQDLERSCSDVACFLFYPQSLPYPIESNRRFLAVKLLFHEDSCKFMH